MQRPLRRRTASQHTVRQQQNTAECTGSPGCLAEVIYALCVYSSEVRCSAHSVCSLLCVAGLPLSLSLSLRSLAQQADSKRIICEGSTPTERFSPVCVYVPCVIAPYPADDAKYGFLFYFGQ